MKKSAYKRSEIDKYDPQAIEKKWQKVWEKEGIYSPDLDKAKRPFYNLMMFPYPSAEGMHVGNMYAFTGADVYGRFKRMQGHDVFEPIGLDGFGIHSENYAIKVGNHPVEQAKISEKNFYRQLKSIGNSFDWTRTVETYKPEYYKWTQWLFIQLLKAGLAYRKKAPVNFCPSCKTVLADEQVLDGKCERCNSMVEKRDLEQWFFAITKYANRLLANIPKLDWSEKVKIAQRLWIGKSEDTEIIFPIKYSDIKITVVTTRADTLFGATFLVLAPEHELVQKLKNKIKNWNEIADYIDKTGKKSEFERGMQKDKTGVELKGITAINPVNNEELPIYIADYVLITYGTGAIMAVPAHDDRDFAFAKEFNLPIRHVIEQPKEIEIIRVHVDDKDLSDLAQKLREMGEAKEYWTPTLRRYDINIKDKEIVVDLLRSSRVASDQLKRVEKGDSFALEKGNLDFGTVYSGDGKHINSDFLNELDKETAIEKMTQWLKEKEFGGKSVHYHLRDWLISRQRYWGPPIPMIYCETCKWQPVPEKDLPVKLPFIEDYKPLGTGKAPLASHPEFYKTTCPNCGGAAKRETDVSDTFLDSSWYFLRYLATDRNDVPFPSEDGRWKMEDGRFAQRAKWLSVNMYIGGAEHSVLHLLYSRFITMALKDLGFINFEEPFAKFRAHGLLVKDGAKMSKSKGNVVIPDQYIKKFGADTVRTYLMFMGPFDQGGDFRDTGVEGMSRFLRRVWKLVHDHIPSMENPSGSSFVGLNEAFVMMNRTVKRVTDDLQELRYNTAIAALMEYYNFLSSQKIVLKEELRMLVRLFAPFAPHLTEELWEQLGGNFSIHKDAWPQVSQAALKAHDATIAIQINGKTREIINVTAKASKDKNVIEQLAKESAKVSKYLEGKKVYRVVYVEGKIINFVTTN